ncbi:MAG TPA: hypothetical protein VEC36_13900 [Patescibacteria group bacterium]|nr:hypothetical protein [Patescibacteria group bacterium]
MNRDFQFQVFHFLYRFLKSFGHTRFIKNNMLCHSPAKGNLTAVGRVRETISFFKKQT